MKDEDVFASTTMTASVKMPLSQATDLRNEGYTLFTANVKTAFLNAHMKGGDVVHAKTATRVAAVNTGSDKKKSDLETTGKSLWPEKRTEPLAGTCWSSSSGSAASSRTCWTLACGHTTMRITRIPRGRLVAGWNAPDHQRNPH